jgi:TRAP-type C4-dicarboxylate transport system permease small subunit
MIAALIGIIFTLIVIGVLWWAIQQLLPLLPLPEPFRKIIYVLLVVIMVLIVLYVIAFLLQGVVGISMPHWIR